MAESTQRGKKTAVARLDIESEDEDEDNAVGEGQAQTSRQLEIQRNRDLATSGTNIVLEEIDMDVLEQFERPEFSQKGGFKAVRGPLFIVDVVLIL